MLKNFRFLNLPGSSAVAVTAFSWRGLVFLLGKISLFAAVVLAERTGNNIRLARRIRLPEANFELAAESSTERTKAEFSDYAIVLSRNIFGARSEKADPNQAQVATSLKLRLVGTNLSPGTPACAIVENGSNKEQDVFEVNEKVFDQAKLIEVLPEKIKLEHNGKIEILALEEGDGGAGGRSEEDGGGDEKTDFTVPEEELNAQLANLPRLLSEARAVPYFRNGSSVGMRLFAIRAGSLYEKLGLKNGDIIKMVNKSSLSDPAQALKLFEQLKSERSIVVKAERNGQDLDLNYTIR